jgi:N-acetylmuramoyl-L-alanine amidase
MKKIVFLLAFLFLLPLDLIGETHFLKIRSSLHPDFSRIVLEGPDNLLKKAIVNQKSQSVMVSIPGSDFSVESEKVVVTYRKTDKDTIMFFPGSFRGLKVFNLKYPARLVIDVYKDRDSGDISFFASPPGERKKTGTARSRTVIIDPGHGGYESGLVRDDYREKNVVMDIAKKLHTLINRGSSISSLTRGSDRYMSQSERVSFANSKGPDVFISLHVGNHSGTVIYVPVMTEQASDNVKPYLYNKGQAEYLNETVTLLNAIKEAIITDFGNDAVSVRPYPYSFISKIESAALMIELPSFEDADYIEEFKTEMAGTLYKGLYIYEEIQTK